MSCQKNLIHLFGISELNEGERESEKIYILSFIWESKKESHHM